jgi:hypothetical protein
METFSTKKSYKSPKKVLRNYICQSCDYMTPYKKDFDKHVRTIKHNGNIMETEETEFSHEKKWHCICNKKYKDRSGLWKHRQTCKFLKGENEPQNINTSYKNKETYLTQCDENGYGYDKIVESSVGAAAIVDNVLTPCLSPEMFMTVIKQNKDLQDFLVEQNKTLMEMASKNMNAFQNNNTNIHNISGNQTNNNNSLNISQTNSNNKFNLQIFLNETCKDAMNIMDFVDTMQIQISDLEKVGSLGFVDGISSIILKNLKALDINQRPLHCSDMKRETMYVKDDNKWEKECEDKVRIKKVIKCVANKNMKVIQEWKKQYPDCVYIDSKKSDQYNKIILESIGGISNEETDMYTNKIIKKIAKEVMINKS